MPSLPRLITALLAYCLFHTTASPRSPDRQVHGRRCVKLHADESSLSSSFARVVNDVVNGPTSDKLQRRGQEAEIMHAYGDRTVTCKFDDGAELDFPMESIAYEVSCKPLSNHGVTPGNETESLDRATDPEGDEPMPSHDRKAMTAREGHDCKSMVAHCASDEWVRMRCPIVCREHFQSQEVGSDGASPDSVVFEMDVAVQTADGGFKTHHSDC